MIKEHFYNSNIVCDELCCYNKATVGGVSSMKKLKKRNGAPAGCIKNNKDDQILWIEKCEKNEVCGTQNCNGCEIVYDSENTFEELKAEYNAITDENKKIYQRYKQIQMSTDNTKEQLSKNDNNINEFTDERETNKRLVEIKLNKDRKTEYILNVLKISIIIIGCLIVLPILVKLKILKKTIGLVILAVCVLIIVCVILYFAYIKNYNRDAHNFSKFNFKNPDSKEIARSKINVDLSESDQARCQAFSEIKATVDLDDIKNNLNMVNYITPTTAADSCPL